MTNLTLTPQKSIFSKIKLFKIYLKKKNHGFSEIFQQTDPPCSIVLPMSVSQLEKSTFHSKFLFPIGWCDFTPAWQNIKQKSNHNPGVRGTGGL